MAALVGPGGWRIEQITVTRDGVRRTVLRVRRGGYFIAEVHNIEELTGLGVDRRPAMQSYDCMAGVGWTREQKPPAEATPTEHVETAALDEQVQVLRAAVAAGRPVPSGRLWGLPDLGGEECWVDIAGAAVLAQVGPRTITGWLARRGPRRNPFPPASRFLYRLYWPAAQIQAWRDTETRLRRSD